MPRPAAKGVEGKARSGFLLNAGDPGDDPQAVVDIGATGKTQGLRRASFGSVAADRSLHYYFAACERYIQELGV